MENWLGLMTFAVLCGVWAIGVLYRQVQELRAELSQLKERLGGR